MSRDQLHLRILATTDIHSYLMDFDYYRDVAVTEFGLVRLAGLIDQARSEVKNHLLLDNGDLIQGNPLGDYLRTYALSHGHPAFMLMNALAYDAATLGNHEFNFDIPYLQAVLSQARFPYVNANIVSAGQPWITPYVILKRTMYTASEQPVTLKIGVIGVLPPQILKWDKRYFDEYALKHAAPIDVLDIKKTITHYVPLMKQEGADIIVVLAHSGFSKKPYEEGAENSAIYLVTIDDVDVVIAGHTHALFPAAGFVADVPLDLEHGLMNNVACVMPGFWGQHLGIIDCYLEYQDGRWQLVKKSAHLRSLAELPPDYSPKAEHYALLAEAHHLARAQMNVAIGTTKTGFYSYLSLIQDDPCIQVVADAQRAHAQEVLQGHPAAHLPLLTAVPLFKVGGRKDYPYFFTEIDQGPLTFRDVADLYLFPNELAVVRINGAELKEWLECSASIYHMIDPECSEAQPLINWAEYRSYNFDVIKGVTYRIDVTKPARYNNDYQVMNATTRRVIELKFQGCPVADTDEFLIVTNHYRAFSGRFPGTGETHVILCIPDEIPQILAEYVQKRVQTEGCLHVIPEYNWALDQQVLASATLSFETCSGATVTEYISNHAVFKTHFTQMDAQGFAVYWLNART